MVIMDVAELRAELHSMIDKISDRNVLNALRTLLADKTSAKADWWETISQEEREEIEQGLSEAEKGEVTPHEQVMEKYKKWL